MRGYNEGKWDQASDLKLMTEAAVLLLLYKLCWSQQLET